MQTARAAHRLRILVASSRGLNGSAAALWLFKDDLFYDFIVSVFACRVGLCDSSAFISLRLCEALLCVSCGSVSSGVQGLFSSLS